MTRLLICAFVSLVGFTPGASAQSTLTPVVIPEAGSTPAKPDPQGHLTAAKQRLDAVAEIPLTTNAKEAADAKKKMSRLREDVAKLQASYRPQNVAAPAAPAASRASSIDSTEAQDLGPQWTPAFYEVERDLVAILGAGSSLSATSPTVVGSSTGPSVTSSNPIASTLPAFTASVAAPGTATGQATASTAAPATNPAAAQVPAPPTGQAVPATGQATPPAAGQGLPAPGGGDLGANAASVNAASPSALAAASAAVTASAQAAGTPATSPASGTVAGAATGSAPANLAGANVLALAAVAASKIGVKDLDPRVRMQLEQVRTSIELFYDATTRVDIP
jgi:hypothetical protein